MSSTSHPLPAHPAPEPAGGSLGTDEGRGGGRVRAPLGASRVVLVLLTSAAFVALAALSPRVLPYNMDEFVHYHALGCATAPEGRDLPSFRDGCGLYDLRLPFTDRWLPLRSYYYIGSVPAAVFSPFWRLLDDPVAARVQGALFFVAFLVFAASLLRLPVAFVLLASLIFPVFAVTFLVDQGPVGLSAGLLLGALLALRRGLRAEAAARGVAWAILSGFLVFVGLWVKPVFAWWLPAALVFVLGEGRRQEGSLRALFRKRRALLVAGGLAAAVPLAVLLAGVDVDGRPYGAALGRGRLSAAPSHVGAGALRLLRYVGDASQLAPRNVSLPASPLDGLPALAAGVILAVGLRRAAPRRSEVAGMALLALLTFALAAASGYTRWPHHFAFPALLLVLALALAVAGMGRGARMAVALVVVAAWASLAARWPRADFPRDSHPDKDALLAFVRDSGLDRRALQVHASWGTYYIAQLFGDRERMVVFVKGISDDARQLEEVACLARANRRPVLLISSRRWPRIQTTDVERILGPPDCTWRFGDWWAVTYAHPGSEGCPPGTGPAAARPLAP